MPGRHFGIIAFDGGFPSFWMTLGLLKSRLESEDLLLILIHIICLSKYYITAYCSIGFVNKPKFNYAELSFLTQLGLQLFLFLAWSGLFWPILAWYGLF